MKLLLEECSIRCLKHDVYVDSNEINRQIGNIVSAYNDYATLIGFANCVGDEIAQIAHSKVAKVTDVWPKDVQGQYQSTSDVYMTSNTDFRQNVRDRASKKLNYITNLGDSIAPPHWRGFYYHK